jgi:hypothetical protein
MAGNEFGSSVTCRRNRCVRLLASSATFLVVAPHDILQLQKPTIGGGLILFRGDPSGIRHDTGRLENHYRYGLGVTLPPVT